METETKFCNWVQVEMKREKRLQKQFALCRCIAYACIGDQLSTNWFSERLGCFGFIPTCSNQTLKTAFKSIPSKNMKTVSFTAN